MKSLCGNPPLGLAHDPDLHSWVLAFGAKPHLETNHLDSSDGHNKALFTAGYKWGHWFDPTPNYGANDTHRSGADGRLFTSSERIIGIQHLRPNDYSPNWKWALSMVGLSVERHSAEPDKPSCCQKRCFYRRAEPRNEASVLVTTRVISRFISLLLCVLPVAAFGQTAAFVVGEKLAGSIGFYDANFHRIGDAKVGGHPHEIALTPDKKTLYVADNGVMWMTETGQGGNTVSIMDIASMKRTATINLGKFRRPHGIAFDSSSGHVYVTTEKPSKLLVLDPKTLKVVRTYDVKGQAPHIVMLGHKREWAYVSDTGTGTLSAINLSSGNVISMPSGERPQGLAMSPDGRTIFAANSGGNSISIFNLAQKWDVGRIMTSGKAPVRVVVSHDGKTLIYALQEGRSVGFADIATRKELLEIPVGGRPVSMSLSLDGKLAYCSVQEEDEIYIISVANRKVVRIVHTPKGTGPDPVVPLR